MKTEDVIELKIKDKDALANACSILRKEIRKHLPTKYKGARQIFPTLVDVHVYALQNTHKGILVIPSVMTKGEEIFIRVPQVILEN